MPHNNFSNTELNATHDLIQCVKGPIVGYSFVTSWICLKLSNNHTIIPSMFERYSHQKADYGEGAFYRYANHG